MNFYSLVESKEFRSLSNSERQYVFSEYFKTYIEPVIRDKPEDYKLQVVSKFHETASKYFLPIEKEPTVKKALLGELMAGVKGAIGGLEEVVGTILPKNFGGDYFQKRGEIQSAEAEALSRTVQEGMRNIEYDKPFDYTIYETLKSPATTIGSMATSIATGAPLATMALSSAGSMKQKLREQGYTPFSSSVLGSIMGATTFLTEKIPMAKFIETFGSKTIREGLKNYLSAVIVDVPGEVIENITERFMLEIAGDDTKTGSEALTKALSSVGSNLGEITRTSAIVNLTPLAFGKAYESVSKVTEVSKETQSPPVKEKIQETGKKIQEKQVDKVEMAASAQEPSGKQPDTTNLAQDLKLDKNRNLIEDAIFSIKDKIKDLREIYYKEESEGSPSLAYDTTPINLPEFIKFFDTYKLTPNISEKALVDKLGVAFYIPDGIMSFVDKHLPSKALLYSNKDPKFTDEIITSTWFHEFIHTYDYIFRKETGSKTNSALYKSMIDAIQKAHDYYRQEFSPQDFIKEFNTFLTKYFGRINSRVPDNLLKGEDLAEVPAYILSMYATNPAFIANEAPNLYNMIKVTEKYVLRSQEYEQPKDKVDAAFPYLLINIVSLRNNARNVEKVKFDRLQQLKEDFAKGEKLDEEIMKERRNNSLKIKNPLVNFIVDAKKAFYDIRSPIIAAVETGAGSYLKDFILKEREKGTPEEVIKNEAEKLKKDIAEASLLVKNSIQKLDYLFNTPYQFLFRRNKYVDKILEREGIDKETYGLYALAKSIISDFENVDLTKLRERIYPPEKSENMTDEEYQKFVDEFHSRFKGTPIPQPPRGLGYQSTKDLLDTLFKSVAAEVGETRAKSMFETMDNILKNDDEIWKDYVIPQITGTLISQESAMNFLERSNYTPRKFLHELEQKLDKPAFTQIVGEIGSIGGVANPYLKKGEYGSFLIQMAYKQEARVTVVDYLKELNLAIPAAREKAFSNSKEKIDPNTGDPSENFIYKFKDINDENTRTLYVMRDGKLEAYYVDKSIYEALSDNPKAELNNTLIFSAFNRIFKSLVTVLQPAWATAAAVKDVYSSYLGIPKVSVIEAFKEFFKARKDVKDWIINGEEPPPDVLDAVEEGLFRLTPSHLDAPLTTGSKYYTILTRYGLKEAFGGQPEKEITYLSNLPEALGLKGTINKLKMSTQEITAVKYVSKMLSSYVKFMNNFVETNEVATKMMAKRLLEKYTEFDQDKVEYYVRNYLGTPNPQRKGSLYSQIETIFPFITMTFKGLAGAIHIAADEWNSSKSFTDFVKTQVMDNRYFYKLFKLSIIPAAFYALATSGALDEEEDNSLKRDIARYYRELPDWKKVGTLSIPLYKTSEGKLVGVSIPTDPISASLRGLFYYALKDKPAEMLKSIVGAPELGPLPSYFTDTISVLSGTSPKTFSGKEVLSPTEMVGLTKFEDYIAWKKLMMYEASKIGLKKFSPDIFSPSEIPTTSVKKLLNTFPFNSLGRFISYEEVGAAEDVRTAVTDINEARALVNLKTERAVQKLYRAVLEDKPLELSNEEIYLLNANNKYARDKLKIFISSDFLDPALNELRKSGKSNAAKVVGLLHILKTGLADNLNKKQEE